MIKIRKAQQEDAPQIAALMILAMEEIIYFFIGKENRDEALHFLKHFIATTNNQYSFENSYVALDNNVIVGQITLYDGERLQALRQPIFDYIEQKYNRKVQLDKETQAGEIYIDTIAVSPLSQGKGIGKILLNYVIDHYVTQREETLGLLVDHANPGAKKLYTAMGFAVVNEITIFDKTMDHLQLVNKTTA